MNYVDSSVGSVLTFWSCTSESSYLRICMKDMNSVVLSNQLEGNLLIEMVRELQHMPKLFMKGGWVR